jgi:ATP-dependent RNA helicase DeaD
MTTEMQTTSAGFAELGLARELIRTLSELGYEEPTPVQRASIPPLIEGRDLLGQAATGTGKTAAFALPLVQAIASGAPRRDKRGISALVLVPTRELAMQVAEAIHRYGSSVNARVLPVYGGQSMHQQLVVLKRGVDVVVATPGRALDHIRRGTMALGGISTVVLDEADEMLDMGFAEDLEAILEATPAGRQTALFSATLAPRIRAIAKRHLNNPVTVSIEAEKAKQGSIPRVRQVAYMVQRAQKPVALGRILDIEDPASAIVFCRTRTEVDELTQKLGSRGYRAQSIHGGLSQDQRDRVMKRFREGALDLLVATDVAARGLDISHLSHVVNFDVPASPDAYVHRIGRTGRAGREGVAITLAEPREARLLRNIEQHIKQKIRIAPIPSVRDLRVRQLDATRDAVRAAAEKGQLDTYRGIAESLAADLDLLDIAAGAIRLVHESANSATGDEEDIAPVAPPREDKAGFGKGPRKGGGKKGKFSHRKAAPKGKWRGS